MLLSIGMLLAEHVFLIKLYRTMRLFPFTFLLAFLMTSVGYAQDATWDTLNTEGFTISYPSTWTVDQSGTMGTEVFIFDAPNHENDLFSENVNLMLSDLMSDTIALLDYGESQRELLPKYITDYEYIATTYIEQDGKAFYQIEYNGKQGPFDLYFNQLLAFKGDVVYILTFTAEQDQVEVYKNIAEQMLLSFELVE